MSQTFIDYMKEEFEKTKSQVALEEFYFEAIKYSHLESFTSTEKYG